MGLAIDVVKVRTCSLCNEVNSLNGVLNVELGISVKQCKREGVKSGDRKIFGCGAKSKKGTSQKDRAEIESIFCVAYRSHQW
jgi:hypothetical protein